ncbi:hypothetical protein MACH09_45680 [Vibrio sp. MACH09]|uniref:hypothetical protein n=1 Tax=Vibrio sp. MACH09 TaxID=3025122 RepID=UPI002792E17D|nr:hypothetical protein [Vibrio sp. MACH09]GLO64060.1 hypothetical protein MACH09_45680 [Vibrio sp. MACH09]
MMNVCESIKGALYDEAAEVVNTLWPKWHRESERGWTLAFRDQSTLRTRVGI